MRVVDEQLLDEGTEDVLLGHAFLELGQGLLEAQGHHRVAVVQPGGERAEHEGETAGEAAGVVLAHGELDGVHRRVNRRLRETLLRDLRDGVLDQLLHLGNILLGHSLETDRERGLAQLVLQTPPDNGLAEARLLERHSKRRRGRAHQQVIEETHRERRLLIEGAVVEQPVDLHEGLLLLVALSGDVRRDNATRLVEERLGADDRVHLLAIELGEETVENLQAILDVVVAVEPHARVGGVVELAVEILELLEGQVGDDAGVAARVDTVGVIREERLLRLTREHGVGGGVHALHLVEHDALEGHLAVRIVELVVPALLEEGLLVGHAARVEHRVQVHVDEVLEILEVAGRHGVARAIGVGHGVEEGVEGTLDELDEGLLDGVLAGAAEDGVLQDVRDAGGVGGGRAEGDAEGLVLVIVGQGHHLRTRLLVLEEEHLGVVLGDVLLAKELEPVQVGGGLELDRGDRGGDRLAVQAAAGDDAGGGGAAKRGADGRGGGEPDARGGGGGCHRHRGCDRGRAAVWGSGDDDASANRCDRADERASERRRDLRGGRSRVPRREM